MTILMIVLAAICALDSQWQYEDSIERIIGFDLDLPYEQLN